MAENNAKNSNIEYTAVRRKVKYPRLEFKTGKLLLVLPENQRSHVEVIEKHRKWIHEKNKFIQMALKHSKKKKLVGRPEGEFKKLAKSIVKGYADEGDFPIEHLFFRKMNSKWGSCSNKKNLTLNTLMKYLPQDIIKYIIYHELVHLREKRHNSSFWKAISSEFPDYERKEKELFAYWFKIQKTVMK